MINKEDIKQELSLKRNGAKGWYHSDETCCTICDKWDKAGILFTNKGGVFSCMRCGVNKPLTVYLKDIGRSDLVEYGESVQINRKIGSLSVEEGEGPKVIELPEKKLPIGSKPITQDDYLDSRGFLPYHYNLFKPVVTQLDIRRRGAVIFQIFDEEGRRIAWLSRSKKSKEWHDENLRLHKEGKADLKLRYDNSLHTDFNKMLGGYSEITEKTHTLILVEGLFDKVPVDNNLYLYESEEIKCNFLFGSKISDEQIDLINNKPQIKDIYILWDYGTLEKSKHYASILYTKTDCSVKVCEIVKKDCDPGDLNREETLDVISKSVNALQFNIGKINHVS